MAVFRFLQSRFAYVLFTATALLGSSAAPAQIVSQSVTSQPPERITVDGNSVDLRTGTFSVSKDWLSIGTGAYGLTLSQHYSSGNGWQDSFSGRLDVQVASNVGSVSASWGNQSWSADGYSGPSRSGDGAMLAGSPYGAGGTVRMRDGTLVEYSDVTSGYYTCTGDTCEVHYWPTTITYPNRVVVTVHYRTYNGLVRVQSVTNNAGYQIKFTYQTDTPTATGWMTRTKATAINNGVEYCDPNADACTLTGSWPSVTWTNNTGTHTISDALSRPTVYSYGSTYFRIRTASATSDNIQYTFALYYEPLHLDSAEYHTTSVTMGSSTWNYAYLDNFSTVPYVRTVTVTDPLTKHTVVTSSGPEVTRGWLIQSIKDPLNRISLVNDGCPGAPAFTFAEGNSQTPACDGRGNVTSTTFQPKSGSGLSSFNTQAIFPAGIGPAPQVECANPITCNHPTAVIDARGARTDYTYDPTHGGVLTETMPAVDLPTASGLHPQKRYSYAQYYAYIKNASGTLVQAATPVWLPTRMAQCRTSEYSSATLTCGAGANDEVVTTYEYAATGSINRLLLRGTVVTSEGVARRTCYAYDDIGNQISATSPRANLANCSASAPTSATTFTTSYRFDAARQLVGTIGPSEPGGAHAVRNTYDSEGHLVQIERGYLTQWKAATILPSAWAAAFQALDITYKTYDVMGRVLTERHGAGATLAQYSYDSLNRKECKAERMNPSAYGSLPSSACTPTTQGSNGPDRITRFYYDDAGELTDEVRAYGTGLQQTYAKYSYTPNGREDWVEDANGNRTDFAYDGFDRLHRWYFPPTTIGTHAANTGDYEQYSYDNNNNRLSLRLRSGETISYSYDALNRRLSKNLPGTTSGDVSYGYDLMSHDLFTKFGTGYGVTNNIVNGLGEVRRTTSTSATDSLQLDFEYDANGNRTKVTWPDGMYAQYTYDELDRVDQVRENGAGAGAGLLADYSYDMLGRRSNVVRGNGTVTTFYYDEISRLQNLVHDLGSTGSDVTFGFGYNNASQIISRTLSNDAYSYFSMPQSKSYTPDGLNRYSAVAGVTFAYDARGNLTSDGSRMFSYDYENHLLSVSGSSSSTLEYDPLGRLQNSTGAGTTTRYLYAGNELVAEYLGSTMLRRYVHSTASDEPIVWYEGSALTDRRWLHADHQGSIIDTSDGTGAGTVYAYSVYGEPAYDNWDGSRFRFTGQVMLPEAKLYHYKARVYDPVLGRFLQTDPVGYQDDLNLYAYVGNDPVGRVDPSGTSGCSLENCPFSAPASLPQGAVDFIGGVGDVAWGMTLGLLGGFSAGEIRESLGIDGGITESGAYQAGFAGGLIASVGLGMVGNTGGVKPPAPGELQAVANSVRTSAAHPAAANQRTIAVGQRANGERVVSSSNGLDKGQAAAAKQAGLHVVPSAKDKHAEENLMNAHDDLTHIGTSKRDPCGTNDHNCAGQMKDRGIIDNNRR